VKKDQNEPNKHQTKKGRTKKLKQSEASEYVC